MDYGYQLLRHVVQQVFGNLGQAARITVLPIILSYALCAVVVYALVGPTFFEVMSLTTAGGNPFASEAEAAAFFRQMVIAFVVCVPIFLIFYSWAAVGWHRFVLLEEYANGFSGAWNWPTIRSYIGALLRLALIMILLGIAGSIVFGIIVSVAPTPGVLTFLSIGASVGFTWVFTRLGLVLPSAALGEYIKMGASWSATKPVSSAILLPIVFIPLVFFMINSLLGFVGVVGGVLTLVAFWLQTLVNLALMTTLYGNLVEGRQLN